VPPPLIAIADLSVFSFRPRFFFVIADTEENKNSRRQLGLGDARLLAEAHLVEYRFCIFSKSLMSILNLFHTKFGVRVNQVSNEEKLIKDISHFEVASIAFAG